MWPPECRPQVQMVIPSDFLAPDTRLNSPLPKIAVGGSPIELSLCSAGSMKLCWVVRCTQSRAIGKSMLVEKVGSSMS